ncbi:hypothetical protein SNOG_14581 [Parastagonospora nodorum SN15]|uniref:Uncharacterized protein n=1 Tax=Phaeosphaeria nodorum (strain SN15 / ATCC MYA-4574 / FGSC 10173) TaxID=321614 RepID=Q0U170_PHANO|nr:hypothetical protein SNOG_14581 [Parastagonospora nodorum SN15]EAT78121.2 hypothetical protein SNOG_14581 [Parastagonospora nodorum SN15]
MARELSPFSARRLLTQQLAQGSNGLPQRKKSRSRSREGSSGNAPPHKEPLPVPEHRSERPMKSSRPRDASRERGVKEAPSAAGRELSPEPYKKPRGSSRERRRDRSRDHTRDRSRDRRRDRDGGRDRSTERKRSRSRDRRRDRSRDKRRDRSKDRDSKRDRSQGPSTVGETARAQETGSAGTDPRKAVAPALPTAHASIEPAQPPQPPPPHHRNVVAEPHHALPLPTSAQRSPSPRKKYPSAASTTQNKRPPNTAVHPPTRRSPTSSPRVP